MSEGARMDAAKLEDLIVEAFKRYEQGLWPVSMRHEAKAIINAAVEEKEHGDRTAI